MKEAVVLVLLAVLIVGGIGIWVANGNSVPFFSSQPAAVPPAGDAQPGADTAKEAVPAKPLKTQTAKVVKKAPAAPSAEAAPPSQPLLVEPVAEVVVAPPAPKQFPSAKEIAVGAERENISERFGQPSLATTTTSDDGRVLETLVYARRSGRDVTVIRIEDGKVLSAYSR
jgi:hypothetical protein